MSKIIYVVDNNEKKDYNYVIREDTVIYHFSINSSSKVNVTLDKENVSFYYYYSTINYEDNDFSIKIVHNKSNTHSEVFNHGVNVKKNKLNFDVTGVVLKNSSKCVCNQENQIINMSDGKSSICPNLLIDNYDVNSNHSAYIGKFKDEEIFYMESRGIPRDACNRLLLNGFLINSDSISYEKVKDFILEIENI